MRSLFLLDRATLVLEKALPTVHQLYQGAGTGKNPPGLLPTGYVTSLITLIAYKTGPVV